MVLMTPLSQGEQPSPLSLIWVPSPPGPVAPSTRLMNGLDTLIACSRRSAATAFQRLIVLTSGGGELMRSVSHLVAEPGCG